MTTFILATIRVRVRGLVTRVWFLSGIPFLQVTLSVRFKGRFYDLQDVSMARRKTSAMLEYLRE